MAQSDKLNGSVELLAKAMRRVFVEAVQEGVQPIKESVDDLNERVTELKGDIKHLETDMESGFAEWRPPDPVMVKIDRDQKPTAGTHPTGVKST